MLLFMEVDVDTLYWLIQYVWTLIAFIFIMYIWPSVVFKKHLAGKSHTYRFSFCTVVMIVVVNLSCIILGLPYLLYDWLYRLLFFGSFLFFLLKDKKIASLTKKRLKNFVGGTYGPKTMFSDVLSYLKTKIKAAGKRFMQFMKGHWFLYISLGILVLFGLIYFSYGSFHDYSFGCGDMYVHTQWTYYLTEGVIFSSGIYPEGMHFFIYSMTAVFGVPLYTGMVFTGCINCFVTLICAYILFKEIFQVKYISLIALALFIFLDVNNSEVLYSMFRMQWALPQEFGYPVMLLCAAYLIRFFRYTVAERKTVKSEIEKAEIKPPIKRKRFRIKIPYCFREENLLIFTLALSGTIIIHFYDTIMAFFLCVGVTIAFVKVLFSKKVLHLIVSIIMGLMIAIVPFVVCFICGIRLQGSLYWAMSLFMPKTESVEVTDEAVTGEENTEKESDSSVSTGEGNQKVAEVSDSAYGYPEGLKLAANTGEGTVKLAAANTSILQKIGNIFNILHDNGYVNIHSARGNWVYVFTMISLCLGVVLSLALFIYRKIKHVTENTSKNYLGYVALALMGIICHLFYCSGVLGLPWIMESYRICSLAVLIAIPVFLVPLDLLFDLLEKKINEKVFCGIFGVLLIGTYGLLKVTDTFHGYLAYQTTRYSSSVMVTKQITEKLPAESFTIVSTTDELYQIIGKGYHEELIQFINQSEVVSYTIPTEYIFIFVEKNPLKRNQTHFFEGPSWLAGRKYYLRYAGGDQASEGDEFLKDTIREDFGNVYFGKFPLDAMVYSTLWERVLLNSKMYVWCQKFNAMYPNELHVYYEDDDFLCYYLKQNPRNLYELATMDPSVMIPPEEYKKPIWPANYRDSMAKEEEEEEEE